MSTSNITKPYYITLESKSTTMKIDKKGLSCYYGDSIDLIIKVLRDGEVKYVDTADVHVLYQDADSNVREQTMADGGLSVINNLVTIHPMDGKLQVGKNFISVKLTIGSETIQLPVIVFIVIDVADTSVIVENESEIQTIAQLKSSLDKIDGITTDIDNLEAQVEADFIAINTNINNKSIALDNQVEAFSDDVDARLLAMDTKINNQNLAIDSVFLKKGIATPYVSGSYIYFKINYTCKTADLVNSMITCVVTGSPYTNTIIQSSGINIAFWKNFDGLVSVNKFVYLDTPVSGNLISPSVAFSVNENTVGGTIIITSKIKATFNTTARCTYTVSGDNIN